MSKLDNLLSRLEKVKRTGKDSYIACCSAHNDKSPSLAIREVEPDKILLKCFAGCSVEEIVNAIGLNLGDLMPTSAPDALRKASPIPFNARDVLACLNHDASLLAIFISDVTQNKPISPEEAANAYKAACRIVAATRMGGVK